MCRDLNTWSGCDFITAQGQTQVMARISGSNSTPKSHIHTHPDKDTYKTINLMLFSITTGSTVANFHWKWTLYCCSFYPCSLYFKKGLKHMRFNSRINLPIIYFKLLCNTRHKAWPCYHQDHVRVSVHIHRGKQLSKWFTAVLNCDDFLNCGYKEELLVIICKNNFCGFLFFFILF